MAEKIRPCIECLGTDIEIGDCGYSSFNVGWGKCRGCGSEVELSTCGCFPRDEIITVWNKKNPLFEELIMRLKASIEVKEMQIESVKRKISMHTQRHMEHKYDKKENKNERT